MSASPAADGVSPIDVMALGRASAAAALYRRAGRLHVTLIVKASFAFVSNGTMPLADAEELARDDGLDVSPIRERADVLFAGHAYAPRGFPVPTLAVRLAVARGQQMLVDKALHVYGDRVPTAERPSPNPAPFVRMPLVYERAVGGPESALNPVGVPLWSPPGQGALPNIVYADPRRRGADGAGYGPIPSSWPPRSRLVSPEAAEGLRRPAPEIDRIDPAYFQAAPEDQRCPFLQGDEWILLDNLHPLHARLVMGLPDAAAEARLYGPSGFEAPVAMSADTLFIDGDAERCSITWRGSYPLADEGQIEGLRAAAGVSTEGSPIEWNLNSAVNRSSSIGGVTVPIPSSGSTTLALPSSSGSLSLKAPFHVAHPGEGKSAEPIPGAPWSPVPAPPPIPPSAALDAHTLVAGDSDEMPEALRRILESPSAAQAIPEPLPPASAPSKPAAWPWASPPPNDEPSRDAKPEAERRPAPAAPSAPMPPPVNKTLYDRFTKKKQ